PAALQQSIPLPAPEHRPAEQAAEPERGLHQVTHRQQPEPPPGRLALQFYHGHIPRGYQTCGKCARNDRTEPAIHHTHTATHRKSRRFNLLFGHSLYLCASVVNCRIFGSPADSPREECENGCVSEAAAEVAERAAGADSARPAEASGPGFAERPPAKDTVD